MLTETFMRNQQDCFLFSFSHFPDPLSPLHAVVPSLSCLDTSDFYKHIPLWGIKGGRTIGWN